MKQLSEGVNCLSGNNAGPTVVILKKTHGNEDGGEMVVDLVINRLTSISKGFLYYGVGNPLASQNRVRFVDFDLNRSYGETNPGGYEGQRAAELKPLLETADFLLDIHSFRKPAPPIICYPGGNFSGLEQIALHLPIETVVYGSGLWPPNQDHIYTDTFVCTHGGLGLTIESGYLTETTTVNSIARGIQKILEDLLGAKVDKVEVVTSPITKKYFQAYKNVVAGNNFSFTKDWSNFEFVPRDTVYAKAKDKEYVASCDSFMLFPKSPESIIEGNEVCILLEKK